MVRAVRLRRRMGQRLTRTRSSPSRYWIFRSLLTLLVGSLSAVSMSSMPKSSVCQGGTSGAWVIWSLVPNYFNLLKTRKVLGILTTRQIRRSSVLVGILFADFVVGYVTFAVTFFPIDVFNGFMIIALSQTGLLGALKAIPFLMVDFLS